jgi:hypothetical protein
MSLFRGALYSLRGHAFSEPDVAGPSPRRGPVRPACGLPQGACILGKAGLGVCFDGNEVDLCGASGSSARQAGSYAAELFLLEQNAATG